MDIVRIRSTDLAATPAAATAPGAASGGEAPAQDAQLPEIVALTAQANLSGPTRVFVVDGGVRLPNEAEQP
jgi:hypothetical protein